MWELCSFLFPFIFIFFLKSVNHFNVLDLEIWLPSLLGFCLKACRAVSMGFCAYKIYKLLVLLRDTSFGSSVLALCIWLVPNNAEQIKLFKYWFIWIWTSYSPICTRFLTHRNKHRHTHIHTLGHHNTSVSKTGLLTSFIGDVHMS